MQKLKFTGAGHLIEASKEALPKVFLAAAKFYRGLGFSPIPIDGSTKRPRLASFKEYFSRVPTDQELEAWFSDSNQELGIALLIPDGILAIDIDDKALWGLLFEKSPQEKAKETVVHDTPRGYRVFLRAPNILKSKTIAPFPGEHRGVELKPARSGYVVAPPTPGYRSLSSPLQPMQELTEEQVRKLERAFELYKKFAVLVDHISKRWQPGNRHELAGPLAGFLRKQGLSQSEASELVSAICRLASDSEWEDRERYIEDTYRKPLSEVAGYTKLIQLLPELEEAIPKTSVAIVTPPAAAASEISETFTFTGDRPFEGRVQVGALTTPLSRFMRLRFKCKDPGECKVATCPLYEGLNLNVDDPARFDPSAFATYFDTNNPLDALSVYAEKRAFSRCSEWRKKVVYMGREERAVTGALVYDLTGREGRAWFIHGERCDLRRAPNWVIADGWLCRGYKGRIGVLIQAFISESEVMAPPPEEVEKARGVLKALTKADNGLEGSAVWSIAELLRRKVNAKGEEVRKGFAADVLMVGSPVWIRTPESGDKELGATTCELGPSTNYKSQRARFLVEWLGAGKYLRGRKTEAGLTAGLEKVEGLGWVAKKGALPSADLSFIIVDNAGPHVLDEQIESRRDGIVSMAGIKSMEIWARTRLKLLNNPLQPFDELVYKCVGLKMFDSKLLARMAFAIYTYGVSVDERYDPAVSALTADEGAVLDAARTVLRFNLSQETTYTVPLSLWPQIMGYSKQLELKYGCEDIPLLLRNIPYKMAVLAYSFALLEGETEPSERHYLLAYEWLDFCARDIELDKYADVQRTLRNLNDEEYAKICKAVEEDIAKDLKEHGGEREDSYMYRLMDYLVKHGTARCDELAVNLEVDEKTVRRKAQLLKGLGLLRSSKDGYAYTPKGVRFIKKWLVHVHNARDVPTFEGHTCIGRGPEASLTPESGDMTDMTDTSPRVCEVCGGPATTRLVRETGVHYLCDKCLAGWEGNL
jgi:hypothetical protein